MTKKNKFLNFEAGVLKFIYLLRNVLEITVASSFLGIFTSI
jgi:hypothetical protein